MRVQCILCSLFWLRHFGFWGFRRVAILGAHQLESYPLLERYFGFGASVLGVLGKWPSWARISWKVFPPAREILWLVNPRQQTVRQPITTTLSCFDVIDGRGRGILQLPGNQTYRALVSMNKRIYARCHQHDKGKVSKGIVAAIRDLVGGRFLEYDKESKTYHDMGDKKATAKTSQALREGLKKIRQQIYSNLEIGRYQSGFDKDFLGSLGVTPVPLPAKKYFECSVQILQSLCNTR